MGVAGEFGFEAAGRLAQGGALVHMAVQNVFDDIRARREDAVDSVSHLAARLQGARRAEAAAERRAAAAEDAAAGLAVEVRLLSKALADERRELAAMKAAYASLLAGRRRAA